MMAAEIGTIVPLDRRQIERTLEAVGAQPDNAVRLVAGHFGILRYPSKRYDVRVEIRSESTEDTSYTVAHARRSGEWSCGCRGWIGWHTRKGPDYRCKHLKAMAPVLEAALELEAMTRPPSLPIPAGVWLP